MSRLTSFIAIFVCVELFSYVYSKVYIDDVEIQKKLWIEFKQSYNKTYSSFEDSTRFQIFVDNMKLADIRNEEDAKAGGTAIHGITKFSDLTQLEFQNKFLTAKATMKPNEIMRSNITLPRITEDLVDWEGIYTTPVRDQGYCGSCWAFSAVEQMESDIMRVHGKYLQLSTQQVTECDEGDSGCAGGWPDSAYMYIAAVAEGIEQEDDYPYDCAASFVDECTADKSKNVASLTWYYNMWGSSEEDIAAYVQSTGPLSICVDANRWNSYSGGILSVCGTDVNHCVQAVGVLPIISATNQISDKGYWKVRNSWGSAWGESGHIRLLYGKDTCFITNNPTHVDPVLLE